MGARALGGGLTARRDPAAGVPPDRARPSAAVRGSIGILGGTFDPIHVGHLACAEEAREALGFERVLFIPASVPPHKSGRPLSSAEDRAAMVELAIASNPAFELSRIELARPGPSYSVDTVAALLEADAAASATRAASAGGAASTTEAAPSTGEPVAIGLAEGLAEPAGAAPFYTFILSAEALLGLPNWHEPQRLLDLCRMAVVARGDLAPPDRAWLQETFPGRADRFTLLEGPRLRISGSAIRARVAAGRSIRYLVPEVVRAYIDDHDLYHGPIWRNTRL